MANPLDEQRAAHVRCLQDFAAAYDAESANGLALRAAIAALTNPLQFVEFASTDEAACERLDAALESFANGVMGMGKSKRIGEYAIGDDIWRHVEGGGTFRYVVQGIRQYEGDVQLEVECQSCRHGYKCRVLLARDDYDRIVAVHMLNEDEDSNERIWHCNEGLHFWPTGAEAREEGLQRIRRRVEDRIRAQEEKLAADRKYLATIVAAIQEPTP